MGIWAYWRHIHEVTKVGIDFRIVFIMVLLVVMLLAFNYLSVDLGFGADSTIISTQFLAVMPALFLFIIGVYLLVNITGLFIIPAFGVLGMGVAQLLRAMYLPPLSMITPSMMSGLSIESIMFYCVIISLLFGGVIGATTSKRRK